MNLATVTTLSPLTVTSVGDTVPVPARASEQVAAGDLVLVETIDNAVFILGRLTEPVISPPPTGVIFAWSTSTAPTGYLLCNFQAVLRADYPALNALAAAAGYTGLWGPGNGSTTFNVPDGRGRQFIGAGTFAAFGATDGLAEASRTPRHTHTVANQAAHLHGMGAGHNHAISTAATHNHNINNTSHSGTSNATGNNTGGGLNRVQTISGSPSGNHDHGGNTGSGGDHDHSGSTGMSGGGIDTQNSGAHDHTGATGLSAATAHPYFAGHWIIKT